MAKIVSYAVTYLTRSHVVLTTSYGAEKQERSHVIVSLTDVNGHVGYGESTPLSKFTGETAKTVQLILEDVLLPRLVGYDSFEIAAVHEMMDRAIAANFAAKSAVDCAMYDLMAKSLGVPLYSLLGGKCRDIVPINRHIGIITTPSAVRMAEEYVAQGFKSLKMKIGGDVSSSSDRICAVRNAVPPEVKLRVDANCGFSYQQAVQLIKRTENCGLEYYEQLLPKWDLEGMGRLRKEFGIPILVDEAVNSVQEAMRYALCGAADAVTIKLCKCGGMYPAIQIAGAAASVGMQVVVASTYDTHIGCSTCLHLASALPNISTACDLTTFAIQPTQAETAHELDGMFLKVGSVPGIGVSSMVDYPMEVK